MKLKILSLSILIPMLIITCILVRNNRQTPVMQLKTVSQTVAADANDSGSQQKENQSKAQDNIKNESAKEESFDSAKYDGKWTSTNHQILDVDGNKGPVGSELYLEFKWDGIAGMSMYDLSGPPANRVASIETEIIFSPQGTGKFEFDNDGWGSYGDGTVELYGDQIIINVDSNIKPENYPDWRIYSGQRVFVRSLN